MSIPAGTQFGPYRILEKIGSGGMGEVYRALDPRLNREVAVKLVSEEFLAEFGAGPEIPGQRTPANAAQASGSAAMSRRRFLREAQASSALNHPNICTIHDIGEQDGRPFLVMELLRGETLKEALAKGPLSVTEVVAFARQTGSGLAAAHAHGVIHRDIKPANMFVVGGEGKRQIKILDFGLAKHEDAESARELTQADGATSAGTELDLTRPGSAIGTVAYMSPEQAEGKPLDARTDLFSLGAVMYEMATGKLPFAGASAAAIFAALLTRQPERVNAVRATAGMPPLPAGMDEIVGKLLEKDPAQRFQTAAELERELEGVGGSSESSAGSSGRQQAVERSRHAIWWVTAAALLLLLAGGMAWWRRRTR